jgi:flagellar biosynthesis/type III secretory pathway protein FliH
MAAREFTLLLPRTLRRVDLPNDFAQPVSHARHDQSSSDDRQGQERQALALAAKGLLEAAQELRTEKKNLLAQMRHMAIDLASTIAAHLIRTKISANDFPIDHIVAETLDKIEGTDSVAIHLHPEDLALLEHSLDQAQKPMAPNRELRFVADPSIVRGNCTAHGQDVRAVSHWEEQLKAIDKRLRESLGDA